MSRTGRQAIDALSELADPSSVCTVADEVLFRQSMSECDQWHRDRNPRYARLWRGAERPMVPVGMFKRGGLDTPVDEDGTWFSSSGTGAGGNTRVFFDRGSLQRIERGMTRIFVDNGFVGFEPANFLLLSPDPSRGSHPGYATTFAKFTACAPVRERVFAVDNDGRFRAALAWNTLRRWAADPSPIFIFGLTVHFERLCLTGTEPIDVRGAVRGLTGGGWKGLSKQLSRAQIVTRLASQMPASLDIRDLFGLTEHPLHYVSCRESHFHVPKYSRFQIINAAGSAAQPGEPGLIRLCNPFFASLPSHDLLTEDQGTWGVDCPCGEPLPYFRFIGRVTPPVGTCAHDASGNL